MARRHEKDWTHPVVIFPPFTFAIVIFISATYVCSVIIPRVVVVPGILSPVPFSVVSH